MWYLYDQMWVKSLFGGIFTLWGPWFTSPLVFFTCVMNSLWLVPSGGFSLLHEDAVFSISWIPHHAPSVWTTHITLEKNCRCSSSMTGGSEQVSDTCIDSRSNQSRCLLRTLTTSTDKMFLHHTQHKAKARRWLPWHSLYAAVWARFPQRNQALAVDSLKIALNHPLLHSRPACCCDIVSLFISRALVWRLPDLISIAL